MSREWNDVWLTQQQIQAGEERLLSPPFFHIQTVHISKLNLLAKRQTAAINKASTSGLVFKTVLFIYFFNCDSYEKVIKQIPVLSAASPH